MGDDGPMLAAHRSESASVSLCAGPRRFTPWESQGASESADHDAFPASTTRPRPRDAGPAAPARRKTPKTSVAAVQRGRRALSLVSTHASLIRAIVERSNLVCWLPTRTCASALLVSGGLTISLHATVGEFFGGSSPAHVRIAADHLGAGERNVNPGRIDPHHAARTRVGSGAIPTGAER